MIDEKESMGTLENGRYWIGEAEERLLNEKNVSWWIDQLWINEKAVDMPVNSGSYVYGSEVPGEIIHAEYWRLDNAGIKLVGETKISLPIGERQELSAYSRSNIPKNMIKRDVCCPRKMDWLPFPSVPEIFFPK